MKKYKYSFIYNENISNKNFKENTLTFMTIN